LIFLLIAGGLPVFLYNSPGKNIFLNIGLGVWDSYNMISGFIGNLLSYIRLFALGLSSAVLGMVFNKLALSLLDMPPVVGHLLFLVLLLIGHSLNLFMAALGSFVHPMRLTFVEFYGTVGFTGGGKEYKPFSKTSKN
jgi:V/A-type H+-transporting ATPase subunit I